MELCVILENLLDLSKQFSNNKSVDHLENSWKETIKSLYDFIKTEEVTYGLRHSTETLSKLLLKNMDSEQIWQQLECQNALLLSDEINTAKANDSNLCLMIAKLSAELCEEGEEEDRETVSDDEGVEMEDEFDDTSTIEEETSASHKDKNDQQNKKNLPSLNTEDLDTEESNSEFSDFSDLDADTFGDIALEGEESEEEEEEEEKEHQPLQQLPQESPQQTHQPMTSSKSTKTKFKSSSLDSQFLNLRESEWVADNDIIGKDNYDEDVNFMEDSEHSEDGEVNETMYNDFFDPPEHGKEGGKDFEEEEIEETNKENKKIKPTSHFEVSLEKEKDLKEDLAEEFYLEEKPWALKGEVKKDQRPENSALEEPLEYSVGVRQKPIITEETTKNIERLLLTRIRSQAWDDVERRIKPNVDFSDYKKKLILDQEKSKKSLAAIYEDEYIRKQEEAKSGITSGGSILLGPEDKGQELEVHKEIKKEINDLFNKLDALSNYHYTPKFKPAEIKVVSNFAAITIEESTPTTASDATLLAPQEVVAPLRGDLKGEAEKTSTDRLRERRKKKLHQKSRARREDQKLNQQLKKKNRHGIMNEDASAKVVHSAVKKGQVKVLEGNQSSMTSSIKFFNELQDKVSSQSKKRKMGTDDSRGRKKNKPSKHLTLAKLLL